MKVFDNIHGYINIDPISTQIINTDEFQRLRHIHQTGILYLVFPTATHTRYEHSIGTYHLAKQMITNIMFKQPELNIKDEMILLVSIAGLCHDLGHLLFSHLFDDCFLPLINIDKTNENINHENRSKVILKHIVSKYDIPLNKSQLTIICDLIDPKKAEYNKWEQQYQIGKWIFQIISNPINSIDVDKFDYLIRDTQAVGLKFSFDFSRILNEARIINNTMCYSTQCSEDIYHMFFIRYRLHRQIYNHQAVKSIEILIVKILLELEKEFKISEYINDVDKMIKLVDHFIWINITNNEIIKNIIGNINKRVIPKMIFQNITLEEVNYDINKINDEIGNNYEIVKFKVGYAGGNSPNPLNRIKFYDSDNNLIISDKKNDIKMFSHFINQKHQEYFYRIYHYDNDIVLNDFDKFMKTIK